eukprot:6182709-Pleurochrysis_carterae.AAC.1
MQMLWTADCPPHVLVLRCGVRCRKDETVFSNLSESTLYAHRRSQMTPISETPLAKLVFLLLHLYLRPHHGKTGFVRFLAHDAVVGPSARQFFPSCGEVYNETLLLSAAHRPSAYSVCCCRQHNVKALVLIAPAILARSKKSADPASNKAESDEAASAAVADPDGSPARASPPPIEHTRQRAPTLLQAARTFGACIAAVLQIWNRIAASISRLVWLSLRLPLRIAIHSPTFWRCAPTPIEFYRSFDHIYDFPSNSTC